MGVVGILGVYQYRCVKIHLQCYLRLIVLMLCYNSTSTSMYTVFAGHYTVTQCNAAASRPPPTWYQCQWNGFYCLEGYVGERYGGGWNRGEEWDRGSDIRGMVAPVGEVAVIHRSALQCDMVVFSYYFL